MKKFFLILTIFISLFFSLIFLFSGCSKNQSSDFIAETMIDNATYDTIIANEISGYENSNNFDEETIKTLSVIIRTNLYNQKLNNNQTQNLKIKNQKIYDIVKSTTGEIIIEEDENEKISHFEINNNEDLNNIYLEDGLNTNNINENNLNLNTWTVTIKKSKILEVLKKYNIKLSSLAKTKIINDENGNAEKFIIGEKEFNFNTIKNEFNLPSNKIIDINNNLSSIKITGKNEEKYDVFSLKEIISASKKENDYKNIIKSKKNSFKIINIQKNAVKNF